jgi:hypothetical protein
MTQCWLATRSFITPVVEFFRPWRSTKTSHGEPEEDTTWGTIRWKVKPASQYLFLAAWVLQRCSVLFLLDPCCSVAVASQLCADLLSANFITYTFYVIFTVHFFYNSQNHTPTKCTIFSLYILQPLHMFRPLQGHHQGARNVHLLYIQCFCLLSHLVQFHCHIYYSYLHCLYLKYIKYTEYKIPTNFVNFRSKMFKWNKIVFCYVFRHWLVL